MLLEKEEIPQLIKIRYELKILPIALFGSLLFKICSCLLLWLDSIISSPKKVCLKSSWWFFMHIAIKSFILYRQSKKHYGETTWKKYDRVFTNKVIVSASYTLPTWSLSSAVSSFVSDNHTASAPWRGHNQLEVKRPGRLIFFFSGSCFEKRLLASDFPFRFSLHRLIQIDLFSKKTNQNCQDLWSMKNKLLFPTPENTRKTLISVVFYKPLTPIL